jgi:acylphosphatase
MPDPENARLHAVVDGHVQGVGFRFYVEEAALALSLDGWVRNRWEGTVEVTAEGPRPDLEKLLATLYRGPRSSTVTGIETEWLPATGEFHGFRVRSTA